MPDQCSNCKYAKKPKGALLNNTALGCRRYPPTPANMGNQLAFIWPSVGPTDWCGEFAPVEPVE